MVATYHLSSSNYTKLLDLSCRLRDGGGAEVPAAN